MVLSVKSGVGIISGKPVNLIRWNAVHTRDPMVQVRLLQLTPFARYARLPGVINADEIARGLPPFDVEAVAFEAGRIMLQQIEKNLEEGNTFSIETTLSTKYYVQLAKTSKKMGYKIVLLFMYLKDAEMAKNRVRMRVEKADIIYRQRE